MNAILTLTIITFLLVAGTLACSVPTSEELPFCGKYVDYPVAQEGRTATDDGVKAEVLRMGELREKCSENFSAMLCWISFPRCNSTGNTSQICTSTCSSVIDGTCGYSSSKVLGSRASLVARCSSARGCFTHDLPTKGSSCDAAPTGLTTCSNYAKHKLSASVSADTTDAELSSQIDNELKGFRISSACKAAYTQTKCLNLFPACDEDTGLSRPLCSDFCSSVLNSPCSFGVMISRVVPLCGSASSSQSSLCDKPAITSSAPMISGSPMFTMALLSLTIILTL